MEVTSIRRAFSTRLVILFRCCLIAGVVAQLGERLNRIQEVVSSILIHSTEISRTLSKLAGFLFGKSGGLHCRT